MIDDIKKLTNAKRMLEENKAEIARIESMCDSLDVEHDDYIVDGDFDYILASLMSSALAYSTQIRLVNRYLSEYIRSNEGKFPIYKYD